LQIENTDSR